MTKAKQAQEREPAALRPPHVLTSSRKWVPSGSRAFSFRTRYRECSPRLEMERRLDTELEPFVFVAIAP